MTCAGVLGELVDRSVRGQSLVADLHEIVFIAQRAAEMALADRRL